MRIDKNVLNNIIRKMRDRKMIPSDLQIKQNIIQTIAEKRTFIKDLNNCLICEKTRFNFDNTEFKWMSNFIMNYANRTQIFTVCPECRIKDINTIYEQLLKRAYKN